MNNIDESIKTLNCSQQQMRLGNLPDYNQEHYYAIETLISAYQEEKEKNARLEQQEKEDRKYLNQYRDCLIEEREKNAKAYTDGARDEAEIYKGKIDKLEQQLAEEKEKREKTEKIKDKIKTECLRTKTLFDTIRKDNGRDIDDFNKGQEYFANKILEEVE
jgi:hypothetical protein